MIDKEYYRLFIKIYHAFQHEQAVVKTLSHQKMINTLNVLADAGVIFAFSQVKNNFFIIYRCNYKFIFYRPLRNKFYKNWYQFQNEYKNNFGTIYIYSENKKLTLTSTAKSSLILKLIRFLVFKLKNATTYIFKNGLEDWMVLFFYADFFNYLWLGIIYAYYAFFLLILFG